MVLGTMAVVAATSNMVGGFLITDRMLKNVQDRPAQTNHEHLLVPSTSSKSPTSSPVDPLHPVAQMAEFAEYGPPRRLAGEIGMLLAVVGTLFNPGIVDYKWIVIALVLGDLHRHSPRPGADDGGAAANRPQPRFRRALRHPDRHGRILSAQPRRSRALTWPCSRWRSSSAR